MSANIGTSLGYDPTIRFDCNLIEKVLSCKPLSYLVHATERCMSSLMLELVLQGFSWWQLTMWVNTLTSPVGWHDIFMFTSQGSLVEIPVAISHISWLNIFTLPSFTFSPKIQILSKSVLTSSYYYLSWNNCRIFFSDQTRLSFWDDLMNISTTVAEMQLPVDACIHR